MLRKLSGIIIPALALLMIMTGCTKKQKEFYPNGQLKSVISYKGDLRNGPAVWYYEDGGKMLECNYKNDELDGLSIRYQPVNGKIERKDFYVNGKKSGQSIVYDKTGFKSSLENYTNDTLNGHYEQYYPDGSILLCGRFAMGQYDSVWNYYDDKGLLVGKGDFVKGNGVLRGFFWNGKLKREINYKNSVKDGIDTWYFQNGQIERQILFSEGKYSELLQGEPDNSANGSTSDSTDIVWQF
jgi:antitoxin component YwqK of YwqJK toxin-antitoxin module